MTSIQKETFICVDCETTGLDPEKDRIIEVAFIKFTFSETLEQFETLIDPECEIPVLSQQIHKISSDMVQGKPKIQQVLPKLLKAINGHIVVGHGILFDLTLIAQEAKKKALAIPQPFFRYIDTLRMARIYGESPINSLEKLRQHFNIEPYGAHRAMSDVIVNIEVFKRLAKPYSTIEELLAKLKKPIRLKTMPLGKYKGRRFDEIPLDYLLWIQKKNFDEDLTYSIRSEIKQRKKRGNFEQASNPFSSL